ncbi:MAG: phage major capsid protein, partial [Mesorhizobium sp.]
MAGPSTTFTEMVSTTLRNSATEVADNVSKNNAFLNRLKKKNKIRNLDGGTE